MELTHCCSKTSIYAIFACTIIRSNTGYRLVISIFCRCRSGPNFPFTTASDTFPSSLNVRSKSLNLCTFEISLWNCDFCRPKARFYVTRLAHFGPPSWNFLFTVPRFLAAPAKLSSTRKQRLKHEARKCRKRSTQNSKPVCSLETWDSPSSSHHASTARIKHDNG